MASEKVQVFTDDNFDTAVIKSEKPVLVDFWAEWCGPCRYLSPTIDAIADELDGRIVVGKLNVDDSPMVPNNFMIRSIPTVMIFKGGKVVEQIVGLTDKANLKRLAEQHV